MPYNMISVRPLTPPISPGIMREREANRRQEVNPLYENRQKARSALLTLLPLLIAGNTSRALALLEYVFLEGEAQTAWTYPVASEALTRMVEDARAEGIELYVGSAYQKY